MNIVHRCPCGASIQVTHLTTREEHRDGQIAAAETVLAPWKDAHVSHIEATIGAHLRNLENPRETTPPTQPTYILEQA